VVRRVGIVAVVLSLVGAGAAGATPNGDGTVVKTAFNKHLHASILVDARGMTLYMWVQDFGKNSVCVDDPQYHCSKLWPPLLTKAKPVAQSGAKQALLGTIERPDHTLQVTYGGHPVYTFAGGGALGMPGDRKAGDVRGQNVINEWWVLAPNGKPIKTTPK
jgi:predicted lipoprotein with Yx(FWY)xxD motif